MRVHAEGVVPNTMGNHELLTPDQIRAYIGYVKTLDPYIPESLTGESAPGQHKKIVRCKALFAPDWPSCSACSYWHPLSRCLLAMSFHTVHEGCHGYVGFATRLPGYLRMQSYAAGNTGDESSLHQVEHCTYTAAVQVS